MALRDILLMETGFKWTLHGWELAAGSQGRGAGSRASVLGERTSRGQGDARQ